MDCNSHNAVRPGGVPAYLNFAIVGEAITGSGHRGHRSLGAANQCAGATSSAVFKNRILAFYGRWGPRKYLYFLSILNI